MKSGVSAFSKLDCLASPMLAHCLKLRLDEAAITM